MKNVVIIVMDTARASDVNPGIDRAFESMSLEENGYTTFESAFATSPWTLPSHASIFTGTYPSKHCAHADHKRLDHELIKFPEILGKHGYETVAVSNNTWVSEEFGFGRGFDKFYRTWQYVQAQNDLGKIARMEEGKDKITEFAKALFDGNPAVNLVNAVYGQYFRKRKDDGARRTNELIRDWIDSRDSSRPFFLFVNYLEPHLEYRPPRKHAEKYLPEGVSYNQAMKVPQDPWGYIAGEVGMSEEDFEVLHSLYRAEISYLSERIKELVQTLKEAAEFEDTVLVITSDHGENIGDHGLMDHQYSLYDTLLHVPLFVRGGSFEEGSIDGLVQLVDLPPTLLDELQIEAPEAREQFQGVSFHPGSDGSRDFVVAEYMAPQPSMEALEKRVSSLPSHVYDYDRCLRAIRTDSFKYIRGSDGSRELYDLRTDPGELNDVSDVETDLVDRFDMRLDKWLNSFEQVRKSGGVSMDPETKSRLEDLGYL